MSTSASSHPDALWVYFDDHTAHVITEATARLVPGPLDDPAEVDHPGAREAAVTRYIDRLLGALDVEPAQVFAGGPIARNGNGRRAFVPLEPGQEIAWKARIAGWRSRYQAGVATLDDLAGGDFTAAHAERQDRILATDPDGFTTLVFAHTIEAMYGRPDYGGNTALAGWASIGFEGDPPPGGHDGAFISAGGAREIYQPDDTGRQILDLIGSANLP